MTRFPSRRSVLALGAAFSALPRFGRAEEVLDLQWSDLVPQGDGVSLDSLGAEGVLQHGELSTGFEQELSSGVTRKYDGRIVRLPGYVVPLAYGGTGLTAFLLAPFVGACIHVPPPPANQLVFVTTERPYENTDLYEPVHVTGMFGVSATGTEVASVGYALSAEDISPYRD